MGGVRTGSRPDLACGPWLPVKRDCLCWGGLSKGVTFQEPRCEHGSYLWQTKRVLILNYGSPSWAVIFFWEDGPFLSERPRNTEASDSITTIHFALSPPVENKWRSVAAPLGALTWSHRCPSLWAQCPSDRLPSLHVVDAFATPSLTTLSFVIQPAPACLRAASSSVFLLLSLCWGFHFYFFTMFSVILPSKSSHHPNS